ncbi:armadillo-type protein [Choanephora cucurbitarum]|nr:armadillo-type protein [Choanephora cucurbitarum]
MATESTTRVLEALSSLYNSTDKQTNREANRWLESFQKKPEAWAVADYLLKSNDVNLETQLFAAQTLKQKITYDLRELDSKARLQLRDGLIERLGQLGDTSKAVMVQLCLAIAILAIQLLEWESVINDLVEKFSHSHKGLVCLLEILKLLPEEMNQNARRLPLTDTEYRTRAEKLIDNNAPHILNLLSVYMQSSGSDSDLQVRIFQCLSSWIRTGEMDIRMLSASPLVQLAFKGLESESLFEVSVDVVSEIIYETRDIDACQDIIQQIYPCFHPMLIKLTEATKEDADEDEEIVRGYCRIFCEAGEAYINLICRHPDAFKILLEGILKCTAYHDLDIVPMTFKFWYELTLALQTETYAQAIPLLAPYYDRLVDVMIGHLKYPVDPMTAEERDEFRDFRHKMGDTLKDCCRILTPQRCLVKPMQLLTGLLSSSEASWQQIEAPIFALRVMGSEVPQDENEVMPHIMEFLSQLPDHPKIRYAATLVISRYSFWTEFHPQYITYQLNFISSGFQNDEVAAASALALKNLCKDCSNHLVDYVPQLQAFYMNVAKSLPFRDVLEVTEAVSHVITVISPSEIQNALQLFCLPVAQELHGLVSKEKESLSQEDYVKIGDLLEQINVFFDIIRPEIPLGQPHPCVTFISELWPVLDTTLTQFGGLDTVSEPLCKCFNSFMLSYGPHFIPFLPQLMERIVNAFNLTCLSCYLWVSLKLVRAFARDEGQRPCFEFVQQLSQVLFVKLQTQQVNTMPDVIEEYFRLIMAFLEHAPLLILNEPSLFSTLFQANLASLSINESHALEAVLKFNYRLLKMTDKSTSILTLYREYGADLTLVLCNGVLDCYSQDLIPDVASIFQLLAETLPSESAQWIMRAINEVPEDYLSADLKSEFMSNWTSAITGQHWVKIRRILSDFAATYRRRNASKDRH